MQKTFPVSSSCDALMETADISATPAPSDAKTFEEVAEVMTVRRKSSFGDLEIPQQKS